VQCRGSVAVDAARMVRHVVPVQLPERRPEFGRLRRALDEEVDELLGCPNLVRQELRDLDSYGLRGFECLPQLRPEVLDQIDRLGRDLLVAIRADLHCRYELEPRLVLVLVGPPQTSGVGPRGPDQLHLGFFVQVGERLHAVELVEMCGPRQGRGSAAGRLRFHFSPAMFTATDFRIVARLYRQLGPNVTELGTESVNLHMRGPLPPGAYTRWRSIGVRSPQVTFDEATDTWTFHGDSEVRRWSEWHRTDAPCLAVSAPAKTRYEEETADRLPFSLRLLENHRGGLCPYCFFGGPAGVNAAL